MHKQPKRDSLYQLKPPPGATDEQCERHPSWRRFTKRYQRKKEIVKDLWIACGIVIALLPLTWQLTALFSLIFISFAILDETE